MTGFDKLYYGWTAFLNSANPLLGLPLCAVGLILVLSGWRLWRVVAVLNLAGLGMAAGFAMSVIQATPPDWRWLGGLAAVAGLAGWVLHKFTAPLLGGLTFGLVGYLVLSGLGLYGPVLWLVAAVCFAAAIGWSYAYRQQVEAVLTSVEGGALLASGLAVMLPQVPILYRFFESMTATSPFMIGFYILVPTVVGVMLQQADLNRSLSKTAEQ